MLRFVGLDVHRRWVEACLVDQRGRVLLRHRFACTREELERFGRERLCSTDRVALEATTNTWAVVSILKPFVAEVVVSHPGKTRAIAEAKIETDRVDAQVLAQLLRCDYLPRVWIAPEETQQLRRLMSRRAGLTEERIELKQRIQSVLAQNLLHPPVKELFSKAGLSWLRELSLAPLQREAVESDLRLLGKVEEEIASLDQILLEKGARDDRVKILVTLPGVDFVVAQALLAALGDLSRFPDGDHAASYLGVVPSTRQSGSHCRHGSITKQGDGYTRALLTQAAQHLATHPGPLGHFFRRLKSKKHHNVAAIAAARKLVQIAWLCLKNNEPYRYALPRATMTKLARLRVRGAGIRYREERLRGQAPPLGEETFGSRRRRRCLSSTAERACHQRSIPTYFHRASSAPSQGAEPKPTTSKSRRSNALRKPLDTLRGNLTPLPLGFQGLRPRTHELAYRLQTVCVGETRRSPRAGTKNREGPRRRTASRDF